MNISFDYYRVFYYTAKYKNITLAANALRYNQPNVTRTIKNLEAALGCTLFVRTNRGVMLTAEGEKLYAHIKIAVEHIEMAESEIQGERSLQSGMVSIGTTEVALRSILLPVLNEFRCRYPGIRLNISNSTTTQAIAALRSGLVDIAAVTTPTGDTKDMVSLTLKEVRETAVCGEAFRHLTEEKLSLKDLTAYPLIALGRNTKSRELYQNWFSENGVDFSPDIEAATADQIIPMVKNNLGIGFVPEEFLADGGGSEIYRLKLEEEMPMRSIVLLRRRGNTLSIASKKLWEIIDAHTAAAPVLPPEIQSHIR